MNASPVALAAALLTSLAFGPAACRQTPSDAAPELRFGRDMCLECGMVIVDERAAAAFGTDGPAPDQPPVFDDIGCLADHLHKHQLSPSRIWVRDFDTKAWIPARSATFLLADGIETPMGSGLAAYASADAARAAADPIKAEILTYPQLADRRLRWRHERFGTPLK